jgi:hypothetical protein
MPTHMDRRAVLARMERACAETARHLDIIERQIAARAERMVITFCAKARQFGRGKGIWTPLDERFYRENRHPALQAPCRNRRFSLQTRPTERRR